MNRVSGAPRHEPARAATQPSQHRDGSSSLRPIRFSIGLTILSAVLLAAWFAFLVAMALAP